MVQYPISVSEVSALQTRNTNTDISSWHHHAHIGKERAQEHSCSPLSFVIFTSPHNNIDMILNACIYRKTAFCYQKKLMCPEEKCVFGLLKLLA